MVSTPLTVSVTTVKVAGKVVSVHLWSAQEVIVMSVVEYSVTVVLETATAQATKVAKDKVENCIFNNERLSE